MFLFCLVFAVFYARLFICALWSPAGKGLTSWLSFVVSSVGLSLSHWYPGSGVVLDCIDSWSLQPYLLSFSRKVLASIFWDSQGGDHDWLSWARSHDKRCRKLQDRGKENWLAVYKPLPTRHKLTWLLRLNVDLKSFLIPLFSWYDTFCSQNWNTNFVVQSIEAMKASWRQ